MMCFIYNREKYYIFKIGRTLELKNKGEFRIFGLPVDIVRSCSWEENGRSLHIIARISSTTNTIHILGILDRRGMRELKKYNLLDDTIHLFPEDTEFQRLVKRIKEKIKGLISL